MEQFDKIIREKVGEKEFPFRTSAWKKFCVKAGINYALSSWQLFAFISAGVLVVGGGTTVLYYQFQATLPNPIEIPALVVQDSDTLVAPIGVTEIDSITAEMTEREQASENSHFQRGQKTKTIETTTSKKSVPKADAEEVEKLKDHNWRISIINPDTIKEN